MSAASTFARTAAASAAATALTFPPDAASIEFDQIQSTASAEAERQLRREKLYIPLVRHQGGLGWNDATKALLKEIGGREAIIRATTIFYGKFYNDKHLRPFLGDMHTDLETHGRRIGMYIAEMMGDKDEPWSHDTQTNRPPNKSTVALANGDAIVVNSRQDAHWAAWHSVKREPRKVGRRFKLDDCRVWMRLFFWAFREAGLADHAPFFSFLVRFIGHFIVIYENTAQEFARQESRWSLNPDNLAKYTASGFVMSDVIDVPYAQARKYLPEDEKSSVSWPWDRTTNF